MLVLAVFGAFACVVIAAIVVFVLHTQATKSKTSTPTTPDTPTTPTTPDTPDTQPRSSDSGGGGWRNAMLTCFEESKNFASGGTDPDKQNVVAVHERDWASLKNKKLALKLPNGTHTVEVRDYCNAKQAVCNTNASAQGNNFLIDINHLALKRLWPSQSCGNTFQTVQFKAS